jgi:hypothetical protein
MVMAKYGEFVYGTTKYGSGSAGTQPTYSGDLIWMINVAWDGSTFVNEAQYARELRLRRGNENYISYSGGGFEPMQPGQAVILLENINRRFDPSSTDSELYPNVRPGLKVRIRVKDINSSAYPLFNGRIQDIRPIGGLELVEMTCVDDMQWINGQDVDIADNFDVDMSTAITKVLDAAGAKNRSIQSENQRMVYFGADRTNAAGLLQRLADACLGNLFVARSGMFKFYNRALAGMTTHTLDQATLLKNIQIAQPWDQLRNAITVYANRWVKTSVHTIWTSPGALLIEPAETKTFTVEFNNPSEIVYPEPDLDYKVSTVLGNEGTSSTLLDSVTIAVSAVTSRGCTLAITNNAAVSLWLIGMRIRGREYLTSYQQADPRGWQSSYGSTTGTTISTKVSYKANDTSSITTYGKRSFVLDNPYLQDGNHAEAFATILKNHFKTPTKNPVIQIDTRPSDQFPIELLDKVALTSTKLGINTTYYVGGLEHRWTEKTGQSVLSTFWLHDRVSSTDVINNENLQIIEVPEIPEEPYPSYPLPGFPGFPEPNPENSECLSKFREMPTGPYDLQISGTITGGTENNEKGAYFPCWLRSAENTYRSYLAVFGEMEESDDGGETWTKTTDWSDVTVTFETGNGFPITATGGSNVTGKSYSFPAVPATPVAIDGIRIQVGSDSDENYEAYEELVSGTLDANGEWAKVVDDAIVGESYSIKFSGGPWYYKNDLGWWSYNGALSTLGVVHNCGGNNFFGFATPDAYFSSYQVIGNYTQVYFLTDSAELNLRCGPDADYSDNIGSLDYVVYGTTIVQVQKRLIIKSAALYNVCPPGA